MVLQLAALVVLAVGSRFSGATFEAIALPLLPSYPVFGLLALGIVEKRSAKIWPLLVVEGALGVAYFLAFRPLIS